MWFMGTIASVSKLIKESLNFMNSVWVFIVLIMLSRSEPPFVNSRILTSDKFEFILFTLMSFRVKFLHFSLKFIKSSLLKTSASHFFSGNIKYCVYNCSPNSFFNKFWISFASLNSFSALRVVNNLLTTFPVDRASPLHLSGGKNIHPKPPAAIAAPPKPNTSFLLVTTLLYFCFIRCFIFI